MVEKHEELQITGEQIRALRQKQGMSHLAFARKLEIPVWLVEILERERMDGSDQLAQYIPAKMRSKFYQLLLEEYGQPETWLSAPSDSPAQEPLTEGKEMTLNLPFTVSPQMVLDWMDAILLLSSDDLSYTNHKERYASFLVANLMQLHQFYCRVWQTQGKAQIAQENIMLLKTRIRQRTREPEAV